MLLDPQLKRSVSERIIAVNRLTRCMAKHKRTLISNLDLRNDGEGGELQSEFGLFLAWEWRSPLAETSDQTLSGVFL